MQKLWFHWTTNERLHFVFDDSRRARGLPPPEVRGHRRPAVVPGRHRHLRVALGRPAAPDAQPGAHAAAAAPRSRTTTSRRISPGPQVAGALTRAVPRALAAGRRPIPWSCPRRQRAPAAPLSRRGGRCRFLGPATVALSRTEPPACSDSSPGDPQPVRRRHRPGRALHLHRDPVLQQPRRLPGAGRSHARSPGDRSLEIVLVLNPQGRGGEGGDRRGAAPGRGGRPPAAGGAPRPATRWGCITPWPTAAGRGERSGQQDSARARTSIPS